MFGYIYKITNKVNNKIYIGKTQDTPELRFKEHLRVTKRGSKQSKLYSAIKCYGPENFYVEEIDQANTLEELNQKEIYWIDFYNSRDPNVGYNISPGGDGGFIFDATGKITIHKDGVNTFINPEDLDYYLSQGWVKGGKELHTKHTANTVWINNGERQKRVKPEELDYWLNEGWVKGYTSKNKETLSKAHLGQVPANKGVPLSDERKANLSNMWTGARKMTDGQIIVMVKHDDIDDYLKKGFTLAGKKYKGGDVNGK